MVEDYETDESDEAGGNEDRSNQLEAGPEGYGHYDDYDESDDGYSIDDKFRQLGEEVAILVAGSTSVIRDKHIERLMSFSLDVHDLALYTKLCYTGFIKFVIHTTIGLPRNVESPPLYFLCKNCQET